MTKQDFELVADVVAGADGPRESKLRLAQDFADRFAKINDRFRRDIFYGRALARNWPSVELDHFAAEHDRQVA